MTDLKTAAARAADWLEANPTKHIVGILATDTAKREVSYSDPHAECFCALGRLGKELGLTDTRSFKEFVNLLGDDGVHEVYSRNDAGADYKSRLGPDGGYEMCDGSGGIEALREIANGNPA